MGLRTKQLDEVWVLGVAYAPALHVRKWDRVEMRKGYLFHSELNEADGDTSLFGKCAEVVRVDNCTAWRPMSDVMDALPRVVHPDDVKCRAIHVAGRDLHFVCGVACCEDVEEGKFILKKIKRENFHDKARQGKARHGKIRQDKARQGKARPGNARQGKARQDKFRQGKARQCKARQEKARQVKSSQGKARQDKARGGKIRQGKARQGKARQGTG